MYTSSFFSLKFSALAIAAGMSVSAGFLAHAATGDTVGDGSSSAASSTASSSVSSSDVQLYLPESGTGMNMLAGEGNIIIEQKNGSGSATIGKWTLIQPDNAQLKGGEPSTNLSSTAAGTYTIFTTLPTGASATIRIYRNGQLEKLIDRPQVTFVLQNNDQIRVVIHYTIIRVGLVAVDSDPTGITFRMNGPNNTHFTGTTPTSFPGMTEGQYQVIYDNLKGCNIPAPQSLRLVAESRVSFTVKLSCAAADKIRERQALEAKGDGMHIMIGTIGNSTAVRDVPQDAWFAPYVANVAKYDILSGYRDEKGALTGQFGPGNNVTVAELAKAAHKIAGISVDAFTKTNPENPRALGAWFTPFFASAESRGWTIFSDAGINPARNASRGEVLVTLLQALDIKLNWQKGSLFTDVSPRTKYAGAIETAAADDVVEGHTDADGKPTNTFGPADSINRAEFAKILSRMVDVYKTGGSSSSSSKKR